MRNWFFILVFSVVLSACSPSVKISDLQHLNGYWQIEKVELADGSDMDYKGNTVYDFFEIKDGKGFRQKVAPKLDGTFETNDISEQVEIKENDGEFVMNYQLNNNTWSEVIESISPDAFVVRNKENTYYYKRAQPINVLGNDQKK